MVNMISKISKNIFITIRASFLISLIVLLIFNADLFANRSASEEKAMIAAESPEAVEAGLKMLRQGGNAIDAAAAAAFAMMVTNPAGCSLGGRSQILIYLNDGQIIGIDGATQVPRMVREPARIGHGYKTAAIPGSPAALEKMIRDFGRLPLRTILQPAIQLARKGFIIKKDYHKLFRKSGKQFRLYPGTAKNFLKQDGTFYSEGEKFCQPLLSKALEIVADKGTGVLYKGKLAQAIANDMRNNSGLVGEDDLAQYRALKGRIVEGNYRGYRIISRGDQCNGASVIEMLHILEHFQLSNYKTDDPIYLHILAQAMYIGWADTDLSDQQQTSKALAARRVREIDKNKALPLPVKKSVRKKEGETNHLSVIDEHGNAVAITQSIGPAFGSKVANPEFGFFYAYSSTMNSNPIPYYREKTSQSPTIVLKGDKPFLIIGSAGGSRITTSILQTIVNVIDHKMSIEKAVSAPRIFLAWQELRIEAVGLSEATLQNLKKLGYNLKIYDDLDGYFGKVNAILKDHLKNRIYGAADPRGYGASGGF